MSGEAHQLVLTPVDFLLLGRLDPLVVPDVRMKMESVTIGCCTLWHADCLEVLPRISGIDAVVSDPQYQLADGKKANVKGSKRGKAGRESNGHIIDGPDWTAFSGDDEPYDPSPWLAFPKVILWGAIHYANRLPNTTSWLVWDKREGTTPDDNADCEVAWSNLGGPARIHRQLWRGLCRRGEENAAIQGAKLNPFQKPVALMAWCLQQAKLTPGQVVLDPYMGSGSTGVACIRAGLKFIGVEIDAVQFHTACKRLEEEQQQMLLAL